ncbi:MAG: GTPase domain-containing protein [Myxococcota bacterium]|nr:GTPase domain-containing protein [Myxococcota bacterium]
MTVINPLAREISAKVVYYGPGLSGKTTTLKHIYSVVKPQRRGELVTLATEGDRTIFFDFLPLQVKEVRGMGVRFQLYTVPGQVFYSATRRLVLQGADGVIFVADSQRAAKQSNLESLADLKKNLAENDIDVDRVPLVFQYNKRDLQGLMSVDELRQDLNWRGVPDFETAATRGDGVLPALKEISKLVIRSLWARFPRSTPETPPSSAPPSSRPASAPPTQRMRKPMEEGIEAELAKVAEQSSGSTELRISDVESEPPPMPEIPRGALSFASLWEGSDAVAVAEVENAIRRGDHFEALERSVAAMVELLAALPGTGEASPMAKAGLLGLDGREFLHFCRLAGLHEGSATERDALFALYMLVSARLKAAQI